MGNHEIIKFDHVKTNVGGAYDPDCGKFEAPEAGMYAFHWVHTNHDRTWMTTELYSNGHIYGKAVSDSGNHNDRSAGSNFVILKLDKGDRVWIRSSDSWHNGKVLGDYLSTFSGYRLFWRLNVNQLRKPYVMQTFIIVWTRTLGIKLLAKLMYNLYFL